MGRLRTKTLGQTGHNPGLPRAGLDDILDVETPSPRNMVRECTSQERSHDKGYSPDGPKQAEGERTLGQGNCHPPLGQPFGPGPTFTRKSLGPDHSPMKDIITVQPEKMPATPSPATALKFPRVSGRTTRCGHGKVGTEVARWAWVGAYRPPTRTALVGAAAQIREPNSKRKMAARNPHFA